MMICLSAKGDAEKVREWGCTPQLKTPPTDLVHTKWAQVNPQLITRRRKAR